uniref:Glycosyl transferase 48 domain-containing protein n=1 Tax=Ammopiptanthus mongolicus TaxID=126911 RepID=A0A4P8PH02_AMMMO|nr:hypothetical protein [Ammopiptanthus mongolicus]
MALVGFRIRFHYGHPGIFDRIFHITRGSISKASRGINLSGGIFADSTPDKNQSFLSWIQGILFTFDMTFASGSFNSTLRRGNLTHYEYIQVGEGRDVGLNQISLFEAKVACGNGEQTLSRDIYRLGHRFDFFRMLSCLLFYDSRILCNGNSFSC